MKGGQVWTYLITTDSVQFTCQMWRVKVPPRTWTGIHFLTISELMVFFERAKENVFVLSTSFQWDCGWRGKTSEWLVCTINVWAERDVILMSKNTRRHAERHEALKAPKQNLFYEWIPRRYCCPNINASRCLTRYPTGRHAPALFISAGVQPLSFYCSSKFTALQNSCPTSLHLLCGRTRHYRNVTEPFQWSRCYLRELFWGAAPASSLLSSTWIHSAFCQTSGTPSKASSFIAADKLLS